MSNPNPNSYSTSNNPYIQGGWEGEGPWINDVASAASSAGAPSPAPSSNSSGSSSGSFGSWYPSQSTYGALPISTIPGAASAPTAGALVHFRFAARGNPAELFLLGPGNRAFYRFTTDATQTVITVPSGEQIAVITWPPMRGGEPQIDRFGSKIRASQFLRALEGGR